jgi:phage repressor protein C with HTH and peptisase S24 domain
MSTGHPGRPIQLNALSINSAWSSNRRMPLTESPQRAEQKLMGAALRNLRERAGLRQADVAIALDMTTQGWQKYESGERKFSRDKIATILKTLRASGEDLDTERARILGRPTTSRVDVHHNQDRDLIFDVYGRARPGTQGVQVFDVGEPVRTIDLRQILGRSTDALEVAGDSMVPWAEPGEIVLFDRERYPKRGTGCVIETKEGEYHIKLYEKSDGSTLFVKELNPEERIVQYMLKDIKGVYAVRLRGD